MTVTPPQGSAASDEELAKALEGLGLEEGGGEGGVLPVMQSLLQHLLSKEVLYPSLKEITEKVRGGLGGTVTPPRDPWDPPVTPVTPSPVPRVAAGAEGGSASGTGHSWG